MEKIRDLLGNANDPKLEVKQGHNGTYMPGLKEIRIVGVEQACTYLSKGMKARVSSATNLNETSSRSHCLMQLSITGTSQISGWASYWLSNSKWFLLSCHKAHWTMVLEVLHLKKTSPRFVTPSLSESGISFDFSLLMQCPWMMPHNHIHTPSLSQTNLLAPHVMSLGCAQKQQNNDTKVKASVASSSYMTLHNISVTSEA